jgi:hypothetical protein
LTSIELPAGLMSLGGRALMRAFMLALT